MFCSPGLGSGPCCGGPKSNYFFKRTNDKRSHHDTTGYDDRSGQIWFVSEIITQMAYPEPEFMLTKK